ncbi:MAG TPA: TRAP transporter large permease subunit [Trueperaceae bacterium]|nr:TRAP transporter large permease subunit [Trueperaceae bacterium]
MEYLAFYMFGAAVVLLLIGFPVAFSLGGTAVLFTLIGSDYLPGLGIDLPWEPLFRFARLNILPQRIYGTIMENYTLVAVPFFVFMGVMLERSGLAEELLETMGILFGRLRGGLAISVVVVGALLAASTGVVGASVVTMGILALPVMLKYNYDKSLSAGVIAASGTLGQIIPPSIVLVILGDQLGISVGQLFLGSFIPGFVLAGLFVVYVAVVAYFRPKVAPALPEEVRRYQPRVLALKVVRSLIPPLFLILVVLGSIFFGIATPTEAGAAGAIGAMLLALINRRLTLKNLTDTMRQTVQLTSMVFIILVGATAFSMVFTALRGDTLVDQFLVNLPGGQWGFLFFTMLTIFLLGFFIDFIEITFIVVPFIAPIAAHFFGQDMMLWFGVVIAMNLQSSFLTPPFGFALFYLKGVAPPEIRTDHIYRGIVPFVIIQVAALVLLIVFPALVNWLPSVSNAQ